MSNENIDGLSSQIAVMAENLSMKNVSNESLQATLLNTVFKGANYDQLVSLVIVANQYGLNPFTKEIYAFPSKGSITPIVSVDGWSRIINDNPQCDGIQFEQDDTSATCKIYRKDRTHPTIVTEYLSECEMTNSPVWKKYPKRMLRHKALIQCARIAFGFSGIYDEDEAHRINGGQVNVMTDVEPVDDGYAAFYETEYPKLLEAAEKGTSELIQAQKMLNSLGDRANAATLWADCSPNLKQTAQQADIDKAATIEDAEVVDEPITEA